MQRCVSGISVTAPGMGPEAGAPCVCGAMTEVTGVQAYQLGICVCVQALQLNEPVSRVRCWELGIKVTINQG